MVECSRGTHHKVILSVIGLHLFQGIDGPIARAVKESLLRHLRYLTEPLVVLSLFDHDVGSDVKLEMATRIHNTPRAQVFVPGRPNFPEQRLQATPTLPDMVGPRSWLMFDLLHMDGDWLASPPHLWEDNDQYQDMSHVVTKLAVVNDAAERGVEDIQDYQNAARDGTCRERIVLVSNSHRLKIPKFLKNEMEENM